MPKDWRGNVRYLLKLLFRWRLNCTEITQASDRRAVFSNHPPKRTPTANLLKEPPPRAALDCAFLRYTASAFPIYALIKSPTSQHCFHSRNRLSKKRRKRFVPSDTSDEQLGSFHHPYASIAQSEGVQHQATRVSPQTVDLLFLLPPPHDDMPSIRNSFTI